MYAFQIHNIYKYETRKSVAIQPHVTVKIYNNSYLANR